MNPKNISDINHKICNFKCDVNCTSSNCEYCGDKSKTYASVYTISNKNKLFLFSSF
jgi:hypothetical protein